MSAKQSVTLNDVAREANVSVATVSRVLNRKARADALTQEKVFKAVKKLGYDLTCMDSEGDHQWKYWDAKIQDVLRWWLKTDLDLQ